MKWLIVRFSAIGDCVMAAHVPSRIRRTQPEAQIHWVAEPHCEPVIDQGSLCQRVHQVEKRDHRGRRLSLAHFRNQLSLFAKLRQEAFDVGLDLQGHSKTAICLRFAKPKRRLALAAVDALAWSLNPHVKKDLSTLHRVEAGLACLTEVLESDASSAPIMPNLDSEWSEIRDQFTKSLPIASIAIGATKANKIYSADNWLIVAKALKAQGFQVVFLGSPGEIAPQMEGTIDLVGRCTLRQSMSIIRSSAITLSADTAAGHIAAAYNVPVVSVFGPMSPKLYRPYTEAGIVLHKGPSPNLVHPDEVLEAATTLIERYGRKIPD